MNIRRLLKPPERSFFLLGPRGVGKSTWLRSSFPKAIFLDLLDAALFLELTQDPHKIEALVGPQKKGAWIVIDEIQKIPALLDEVHRLIEAHGWRFVLCGSSARKLRRSGVNLLGGRALTRHLEIFSYQELKNAFSLETALNWGLLPFVLTDPQNAADILNSYISTYLKEEIREEGIIRRLAPFVRFLSVAGLMNGQQINGQNIATEASVPRATVDNYFSILEETLIGHFLPVYRPRAKVREQTHPKFFWFDPGVARAAAGLLHETPDAIWKGTALETLIFHELRVYNHIHQRHHPIHYYRTARNVEIDFVIETQKKRPGNPPHLICIEVKSASKWNRKWEKPMHDLKNTQAVHVDKMVGVYDGERTYHFKNVTVYPVKTFLKELHKNQIF